MFSGGRTKESEMTTKTIKQGKLYARLTLPEGALIVVNGRVMQYNAGVFRSLPQQKTIKIDWREEPDDDEETS